jgi:hypothetical protein
MLWSALEVRGSQLESDSLISRKSGCAASLKTLSPNVEPSTQSHLMIGDTKTGTTTHARVEILDPLIATTTMSLEMERPA